MFRLEGRGVFFGRTMIRKLLILLASPALLITPVLTVCHHGDDGHMEFLGHCHEGSPSAPSVEKGCAWSHEGHRHAHVESDPAAPVSVNAPPLEHVKLRATDLASFGFRLGTVPLETGTVAGTTWRVPFHPVNPPTGFRGREPPRAPAVILLTRSLLL